MKKKRKGTGIIIVLIVLIIGCLTCGTIGYIKDKELNNTNKNNSSNNKPNNKPNTNKDFQATYRYYIDGTEVEEILNTEKENYKYDRYTCTNNITGDFDEENWEFVPELTANTTCRLYFLKKFHTVTFKANNGVLPSNNTTEEITVELDKEEKINITGNPGYKYDKVECTNDTVANYDTGTSDLSVSNVKKDSTCTVTFKISDYTAEVTATNGSVSEPKKSANYGGTVEFDVTPSENYRYRNTTCSNNQNANYNEETGKLTITGLTNDTVCNVEFSPIRYNVTLELTNGTVLNTSQNPQSIAEGRNASFGISANPGYVITGADASCTGGFKIEVSSGIVSVYGITSDTTCKVVLKEESTTNSNNN